MIPIIVSLIAAILPYSSAFGSELLLQKWTIENKGLIPLSEITSLFSIPTKPVTHELTPSEAKPTFEEYKSMSGQDFQTHELLGRYHLLYGVDDTTYSKISDGKGVNSTGGLERLVGTNMTPWFEENNTLDELNISQGTLFPISYIDIKTIVGYNPTVGGSVPIIHFHKETNEEAKAGMPVIIITLGWKPNRVDFLSTDYLYVKIDFVDGKSESIKLPVEVREPFNEMTQEFKPGVYSYTNGNFIMNLVYSGYGSGAPEECRLPDFDTYYSSRNSPEIQKRENFINENEGYCTDLVLKNKKVIGYIDWIRTKKGPIRGGYSFYTNSKYIWIFVENIQENKERIERDAFLKKQEEEWSQY